MNRNGVGMISKDYSTQDYVNLKLCINSDADTWEKAIEVVEKRFSERFLKIFTFYHVIGKKV